MKPLLTTSRPTLVETLPAFCGPCAQFLTTAEQRGVAVPLDDEGVTRDESNFTLGDMEGSSLTSGD